MAVAAAVLIGACSSGNSTAGNVTATIGGVSWHSLTVTDGAFDVPVSVP